MQIKFCSTLFLTFFCSFILVAQPSNDTWTHPQDVLLSTDGNCGNAVMGTTLGANETQYRGNCYGTNLTSDVWYRFVATSTSVRILIEGITLQDPVIQVIYGDTTRAYSVVCEDHQKGNTEEAIPSSLKIGAPYFIRVFSSLGTVGAGTFSICVRPPQPPPTNDLCDNATELIPSSDLTCTSSIQGTTLGATRGIDTGGDYQDGYDDDVWYYFTATAPKHIISIDYTLTNGSSSFGPIIEVLSGACPALQNIGTFNKSAKLEGLAIGTVYRLRIYTYDDNAFMNFSLCLRTPGPPPANDECSGAIFLPVNGVDCTNDANVSTANATLNYTSCSWGNPDDVVWYAFVATAPVHTISIYNIQPISSFDQDSISIDASLGTCSNLNTLYCNLKNRNSLTLPNLTPGETVYLQLSTDNRLTYLNFNICVTTPLQGPVNDVCSGATELIPSTMAQCTNPIAGTTVNAYNSDPSIYYAGSPAIDVWYKFTATATIHEILLQNLTFVKPVIRIYSDTNCEPTYSLNPDEVVSSMGNKVRYDGFTVGATYYIRVYSKSYKTDGMGTFTICINSYAQTVSNDACNSSIKLIENLGNCANNISSTTSGATPSYHYQYTEGADDDVWFHFTATAIIQKIIVEGSTLENPVIKVYEDACDSISYELYGLDNLSGNLEEGYWTYLTIGKTYLVRVFSSALGTGQGAFSICLQQIPPPPNDNCDNATTLNPSPGLICTNVMADTTISATQSLSGCSGAGADDDVWYSFTAISSSHIIDLFDIVSIRGLTVSPIIEAFSGSCSLLSSLYCKQSNTLNMSNLIVGNTYKVRVYSSQVSMPMAFNICLRTAPSPPVNDKCTGAISLVVDSGNCNTSPIYSTAGATSSNISCSFFYPEDDDVWFSFVATNAIHIITLSDVQYLSPLYPFQSIGMHSFSGTCSNLTSLTCGYGTKMVMANLTPGETYFVSVSTASSFIFASFRICVTTSFQPPLNDLCNGAIALIPSATPECTNAMVGTTIDAYNSILPTCADGSATDDVWYKFTATSPAHTVSVYALTMVEPVIEIYSGNCDSPTLIFCLLYQGNPDPYFAKLDGLTIGATYFIRIYSRSDNSANEGTFSVCITTPLFLNANDPCDTAIEIPVNPGEACVQSIKDNNYGAGASVFPSCVGYAENDVWYKFTATSTNHTINVDSTSISDLVLQVFKGTCSALIPIKCIDDKSYGGEKKIITGLIPGSVYYLRIYGKWQISQSRGKFRICITTLLVNDNCNTPISLTVTPTCTNPLVQNSSGATPYALLPQCAGEPDDDLWFTFVATTPTQSIVIGASPNDYTAVIEVFRGSCLGAYVGCKANTSGDSIFTYTLNTLIANTKYYVRVFRKEIGGGAFSICVIGATSGTENGILSSDQINIYPNPVNDLLSIEVAENIEVKYITLLDMQTRVCIHHDTPNNTSQLDLSRLPSGIYIIQIQTTQGFYYNKVVKE